MESTLTHAKRLFPPDFTFGAAVSSYQIEGAVDEDGRSESIWDRFTATPGQIIDGSSGRVACDSYHRYVDDVGLLRELGVNAFRFSIAWPRILPEGTGRPNEAGLDFYDRFVDELLAAGIEPFVTLYHWDLPQVLEDSGGWPVRATAEAFAEYVAVVSSRLGDRVRNWITMCEPWVVAWLGYCTGEHAPGRKSERDAFAAAHHVLLGHGLAAGVLRRTLSDARVGITIDCVPMYPATESEADVEAVREVDVFRNRWILDPVFRGEYPAEMLERFSPDAPAIVEGDMEVISSPLDFLGVNTYTRNIVRADPETGRPETVVAEGVEHTAKGWEVFPEALTNVLLRLWNDYTPPELYITENGAAFPDVLADGAVDDPRRVSYLDTHLAAVAQAIDEGVPVGGYFLWSLLDNFEWARGYTERFGIVYVNFETLERIPKASYYWYRDFIAAQRGAPSLA